MFIGAGVRVGVAVDGLEHYFSILELHLLILLFVVLLDNLLLALPLSSGGAVVTQVQLLLLVELLRKLLDS
jgi:hypothetical protein